MQFNDKWLNKTYAIEDIEKEIDTQRKLFTNNSLLIANTCQAYELNSEKYLNMLKNKQDIETIIAMINNDFNTKKEYTLKDIAKKVEDDLPFAKQDFEDVADVELLTYTLQLKGTRLQLKALKQFLQDNDIEYEKVE